MIRLNTVVAKEAWEDFQGHLVDVGLLKDLDALEGFSAGDVFREKNRHLLAKMAFKQGFAMSAVVDEFKLDSTDFITDPEPIEIIRTHRIQEQIEKDNNSLVALLSGNIEPMKLENIIKFMQGFGHTHWTTNNGSGFVKKAIQMGAPIEWVERGVYVYSAATQ